MINSLRLVRQDSQYTPNPVVIFIYCIPFSSGVMLRAGVMHTDSIFVDIVMPRLAG
jgi:hypothetical protein